MDDADGNADVHRPLFAILRKTADARHAADRGHDAFAGKLVFQRFVLRLAEARLLVRHSAELLRVLHAARGDGLADAVELILRKRGERLLRPARRFRENAHLLARAKIFV